MATAMPGLPGYPGMSRLSHDHRGSGVVLFFVGTPPEIPKRHSVSFWLRRKFRRGTPFRFGSTGNSDEAKTKKEPFSGFPAGCLHFDVPGNSGRVQNLSGAGNSGRGQKRSGLAVPGGRRQGRSCCRWFLPAVSRAGHRQFSFNSGSNVFNSNPTSL